MANPNHDGQSFILLVMAFRYVVRNEGVHLSEEAIAGMSPVCSSSHQAHPPAARPPPPPPPLLQTAPPNTFLQPSPCSLAPEPVGPLTAVNGRARQSGPLNAPRQVARRRLVRESCSVAGAVEYGEGAEVPIGQDARLTASATRQHRLPGTLRIVTSYTAGSTGL